MANARANLGANVKERRIRGAGARDLVTAQDPDKVTAPVKILIVDHLEQNLRWLEELCGAGEYDGREACGLCAAGRLAGWRALAALGEFTGRAGAAAAGAG